MFEEKPIEVKNMETLNKALDDELDCNSGSQYDNAGFIDFHEPEVIDDFTYRQLQFKKYGYAVSAQGD